METIYRINGKEFTNYEEAQKYEAEVEKKLAEAKKLTEEREKRTQEVNEAYHNYEELRDKYFADYGRPAMNWQNFFEDFFN